jgi:hypothetical protein
MQSAPKIGNDDLLKRWLNPWNARFAGVLVSADPEHSDVLSALGPRSVDSYNCASGYRTARPRRHVT